MDILLNMELPQGDEESETQRVCVTEDGARNKVTLSWLIICL